MAVGNPSVGDRPRHMWVPRVGTCRALQGYDAGTRGTDPRRPNGTLRAAAPPPPPRAHGGIVRESAPGFRAKTAKVQLMLRKHFRTTFGPKAAKAPLLQGCPKR